MCLHDNKSLFAETIEGNNIHIGISIAHSIIEKDCCVTMLLKLLAAVNPDIF